MSRSVPPKLELTAEQVRKLIENGPADLFLDMPVPHGYVCISGGSMPGVPLSVPLLHWAAFVGDLALARLCIERGADPSWDRCGSGTALHLAAAGGHVEAVKLLHAALPSSLNSWVSSYGNELPLQLAVATPDYEAVVAYLVGAGARLTERDGTGLSHTPLERAVHLGAWGAATFLLDTYPPAQLGCSADFRGQHPELAPPRAAGRARPPRPGSAADPVPAGLVEQLAAMGFGRDAAQAALSVSGNDVPSAVEQLLQREG